MLKKIVIAAALVVSTGTAIAADSNPFYAGVEVGSAKLDGISGRKTGFGGFVGYQFNENLAVEGSYRRLASFTVSGVDIDVNQAAVSVLGIAPMGNGLNVFARLGYGKGDISGSTSKVKVTAGESGVVFGLGMGYSFSSNVSARFELQRAATDVTSVNAGLVFKF